MSDQVQNKTQYVIGKWRAHCDNNPDYIDIDEDFARVCSVCLDVSDIAFDPDTPADTPEREIRRRKYWAAMIEMAPAFHSLVLSMIKEAGDRSTLSYPMRSLIAAGQMLCDIVEAGPTRDFSRRP